MMSQAISDVSVPLEDVTVNDVPAVLADTRNHPGVPPPDWLSKKIREFAVTAVVFTVTAPATNVAEPIVALAPSLTLNPAPAVARFTLPANVSPALDVARLP